MIVSEDPFLRELVCCALCGLNVEVRSPETADLARQLGLNMLFDLVIVLTAAPFAICCELQRERAKSQRRPLIYVVAWQQSEQTVLSMLESGVDQYMTLPLNLKRLRRKVADELNHIAL